jgi:hypothetical protein
MTHQQLKPYLPPTHAELRKQQEETIARIKDNASRKGSKLESERRTGGNYEMIFASPEGIRVLCTVTPDGLYKGTRL